MATRRPVASDLGLDNLLRTGSTGMARPAWGTCAADRLLTWSERSMHSDRAVQRRSAGALRLKCRPAGEGVRTPTAGPGPGAKGFIDSAVPVRAACEGVHTPRRQQFPRGRPSGEQRSILPVMPGLRDHAPRFLWSETSVESRTSRTLWRRRSDKKASYKTHPATFWQSVHNSSPRPGAGSLPPESEGQRPEQPLPAQQSAALPPVQPL